MFPRQEWMESFGRKIQSVKPIINYARGHMVTKEIIKEAQQAAKEMNHYMKKQ